MTNVTGQQPSSAFLELKAFAERHSAATLLLRTATQDYAAARCLLQNLMITGLVLGAQAIEKYFKAHILLVQPNRNVRDLRHSLSKLLEEADALEPYLALMRFAPLVERFRGHYQTRYPDNPDRSTSMTTADLGELDEIVVFLNENLPCPRNVKYRTGFYAEVTFSLGLARTVTPTEHWIKQGNRALAPLLPRIADEYREVIRALHPNAAT